MISRETARQLREELEPVYSQLPADEQYPAWRLPNCYEWSALALPIARSILGRQVERVTYDNASLRRYDQRPAPHLPGGFHVYLADTTALDPLVICGTYLQFQGHPAQPGPEHILISDASQTPQMLETAGVDCGTWPYFRADLHLGTIITARR